MWLLFVRNGACGGGREEERGESEVCSGDAVTPAYVYMCECVNVCLFEEEKACLRQVFVSLDVCALVCRVRERETGQRVKVIML